MHAPPDHALPSRPRGRRMALAVAAVFSLAGIFGVSPQVVAAASTPAPAIGNGNVGTASRQSDHAVREYWTPARMASARDAGGAPAPASEPAVRSEAEALGERETVPGATGSLGPAPADGGAEHYEATTVPKPYTDLPDRLNGKVFFTKSTGGNFVCSGTLINNSRKNLVFTAGHCVHGGPGGGFHVNWAFVPAYDGTKSGTGQRPYGTWTAKELFTRTAWINNEDTTQDLGIALLNNDNDGQPLGALIGGQGITFNASATQNYSDFGYPAAAPFNGTIQWRCNSTLRGRDTSMPGSGPDPLRIECDMTGGSSGGGWLINIGSNGLGSVASVNSYGYPFDPGFEYGPYFGDEAKSLYDFAKDRGPAPK